MKTHDTGEGIIAANAGWTFGSDTPKRFDKHVRRSVPLYDAGHELILGLSDFFVKRDSICYDLGMATGTLIRKLSARHPGSVRWVGIDSEEGMIAKAREGLKTLDKKEPNIEFIHDDINTFTFEESDLMIAYYTIQFVPPSLRQEVLNRIYGALKWGGAFILFEKVRGADARFQDILTNLYTDYKLAQGYEPHEIIAKARSLKGILEPFSTQGNLDLLRRAGFVDIMTVFKYMCFEGFLCVK